MKNFIKDLIEELIIGKDGMPGGLAVTMIGFIGWAGTTVILYCMGLPFHTAVLFVPVNLLLLLLIGGLISLIIFIRKFIKKL